MRACIIRIHSLFSCVVLHNGGERAKGIGYDSQRSGANATFVLLSS